MTDKSVVQFQKLLKPIQKGLNEIDKRLDQHDKSFDAINKKLGTIDGRLDGIDENLRQHTEALVNIEDTIKVYGDMYQINNDNARKLEKRVDVLENSEGIVPPPELRLADF